MGSDTQTDRGPADVRRRAAQRYGTPALADWLAGEGRDHTWALLARHHARIQITTTPVGDDPPAPRGNHAAAAVLADRVALGSDGWRLDLPPVVAYCSLSRDATGWKVAAIAFADSSSTVSTG